MPEESQSVTSEAKSAPEAQRWADVKAIFELAVTLESSEWSSFLDVRCGSDEGLRREVESLLLAHDDSSGFLEEPLEFVNSLVDVEAERKPAVPQVGNRIGAYSLEKEIGHGGMGTVYLANRADDEFEKRVAIKLIRVEKQSDFAVRRFRQERQILARLEHPYVARLIDGGTTDFGLPYFVMEYVEGEILTHYCDAHELPWRERLQLFLKICSAVQYAHERNIIHRDLKPGNILVKKNGTPKLLDFGIAKMLEADGASGKEATVAGFRMLTPAYASPEQMRGDPATTRSDVYSLGVILYELLCGERPSLRAVQQSASGSQEREAHLSPRLRAIVFNAIRLDPDERYLSVAALVDDIQRYLEGAPLKAGSVAEREGSESISIGILPFRELGQDSSADPFLRSAITDALITRLSRVERLSVRPTSAVLKYSQRNDAVRAARELRVKYILEGTLHTVGQHVRLNVQLVSAETGIAVWAAHFEEHANDLLTLEDSISEQIAYALIPQLTGEERSQLNRAGTASGKAHEAYLRGRFHWSRSAGEPEELAKALVYFMEAIAEDPQYARAHAGVADYYLRLGLWGGMPPAESFAAGIEAAQKALKLDPGLAEAHATLGFCIWAYHRDYATAEKEFHLAIAYNPEYASAHHWFGLLNSARNRPELALANLECAHKIDPNSPVIAAALGFVHYNARQYPQSLELLLTAARDLRHSAVIQEMLTWCYLQLGNMEKALESASCAADLGGRSPSALAALARAEAACGHQKTAEAVCRELHDLAGTRYVSGYDVASGFLAAGDTANAVVQLEQALRNRDWWVCWIGVDPRWDALRRDRRFAELVTKTQPSESTGNSTDLTLGGRVRKRDPVGLALLSAVFLLVLLGTFLAWRKYNAHPMPFENARFSRLTGDGTAGLAAISEDGKHVTYTTVKGGTTTVWLRDMIGSVPVRQLTALPGEITGLGFTFGGAQLGFQNHPTLQPFSRVLYTVPVAGGVPHRLLDPMGGPAGLSYDGSYAALIRANAASGRDELWVADIQRGGERMLTSIRYPERLAWSAPPAWSADKELIAYAVEQTDRRGSLMSVNAVEVATGAIHRVSGPRWLWIQHVAWAADTGLAVAGREEGSSFQQLWFVKYPAGGATRLGNDLDSYEGTSITKDRSEMVSVQVQTLSNIYILRRDNSSPVQITPGTGRYFDLSWTADRKLLYASDATGSADIWMMNSDGGDPHQLSAGEGMNWAPVSDPNDKFIAFHSNRAGVWQVWRSDLDGRNAIQLTTGAQDSTWPHFTGNGRDLLFQHADRNGHTTLWKMADDGGAVVQLTKALTAHAVSSPLDGRIAAWYSPDSDNQQWKLAIFAPQSGEPVKVFDAGMPITPESQIAWTPSGDGITFLGVRDGVFNLWIQPVNGGLPKPLTSFTSGQIYSFDWSKDGRLAFSRGLTTSDVVVVRSATSRR